MVILGIRRNDYFSFRIVVALYLHRVDYELFMQNRIIFIS